MLTNVFGFEIEYESWNKQNSLPIYISGNYKFYMAFICETRCIIIKPTGETDTLPALKKHIEKIKEIDDVPVVLQLNSVSFYRRKSLIENRIPFMTDKQVYLPFIGTFLTNERKDKKEKIDKFVFSTQQLVLLYLYTNESKLYISDATKILPFTAMTLSRAVRQLESTELFNITKDGVNKVIESKYEKYELFNRIKGYLSNPVCIKGYIEKEKITKNMILAGESALSEYTMLNSGRIITYAVNEKDFDKSLLIDELIDPLKQVQLELWKYDPKFFSDGEVADKLSVALSFMEDKDERIEEAVDELIEKELRK